MSRITAQIAVEAIVNHAEDGYTLTDMIAVQDDGHAAGVPALYMEMLAELITATAEAQA